MTRQSTFGGWAKLWGAAVVVLTVIATNASTPTRSWADDSILAAEGGSFAEPLINLLQNDNQAVAAIQPLIPQFFDANVDGGRADFAAGVAPTGQPVDYAVSELPLTQADMATAASNHRSFAYVPFAALPVTVAEVVVCDVTPPIHQGTFCGPLQFTVAQLAKMFTSGVTQWNDGQLTVNNPSLTGVDSSSLGVSPVNEVQPSYSNLALASLFVNDKTAEPTWHLFLQHHNVSDETPTDLWPTGEGTSGGDNGLAEAMQKLDTTTGLPPTNVQTWGVLGQVGALPSDYVGAPRNIPTAAIQNAAGAFVAPTVNAMTAALNDATLDPATNLVTFKASTTDQAAYALPSIDYLVVPTSGLDATKAKAMAAFIRFVLGSQGQSEVGSMGAAKVTPAMVSAGLHVADLVAAQQGGGSSPVTTTTTTTPSSTTTTAALAGNTSSSSAGGASSGQGGGGSAPTGAAGSGGTGSGDTGAQLAFTGGVPWPIPIAGSAMFALGYTTRRVLRRRLAPRSST